MIELKSRLFFRAVQPDIGNLLPLGPKSRPTQPCHWKEEFLRVLSFMVTGWEMRSLRETTGKKAGVETREAADA